MIFTTTSYNMQTSGDYAVTKTNDGKYFAWHLSELLGTCATANEAKAMCADYGRGKK